MLRAYRNPFQGPFGIPVRASRRYGMKIGNWSLGRRKDEGAGQGGTPAQPPDGLTDAGVREALRDVRDPEIGRDLVSLNMVRQVAIQGRSEEHTSELQSRQYLVCR